jgi:hypothetical protein
MKKYRVREGSFFDYFRYGFAVSHETDFSHTSEISESTGTIEGVVD